MPEVWRTWWLSDVSGGLLVVPLVLAWSQPGWTLGGRERRLEAGVLAACVVGLSLAVFSMDTPLTYVVFPLLIWAAVRFGQRGGTLAAIVACAIAVWQTAQRNGPFVMQSIGDDALITQLFLAVGMLTALCLSGAVAERERAAYELVESRRREVERAAAERQRIARDLHDSVQQTLFSMTLQARTAEREIEQPPERTANGSRARCATSPSWRATRSPRCVR